MATAHFSQSSAPRPAPRPRAPLYTPEQRRRRDATPWTTVQAVLAPLQFVVFLASLALIARYMLWDVGLPAAIASVVFKTLILYVIMITGAIWEREVFGCYLFADAFFWEDVVSFVVLALHTAYLVGLTTHALSNDALLVLALSAYGAYFVNAIQFLMKFRAARLAGPQAGESPLTPVAGLTS